MANYRSLESLRRRVCTIIDIGTADDLISRAYDIFYTLVILVNLEKHLNRDNRSVSTRKRLFSITLFD